MKSIYIRSGLALVCAATLAACGGGNGNMVLGGRIVGLTQDGMVLKNGSWETKPKKGEGTFQFAELIGDDQQFNIVIDHQPDNSKCEITGNKNKANTYTVAQTVISCITDSYALGGTVTGLDTDNSGLVLANGPNSIGVDAPATSGTAVKFNFAKVMVGAPYGVTVLAQPKGKTCTVSKGTGTMAVGAVDTIAVDCTK